MFYINQTGNISSGVQGSKEVNVGDGGVAIFIMAAIKIARQVLKHMTEILTVNNVS